MRDVMIDLETLGTDPSCVIAAIGACRFDWKEGSIGDTFYSNVNCETQYERTTSVSTVLWWLKQEQQAQIIFTECGPELHEVLHELSEWIRPDDLVWSNGISFDIAILDNAYGYEPPWKHYNERDVRTISSLNPDIKKTAVLTGVKHNALADAMFQARYVSDTLAWIHAK